MSNSTEQSFLQAIVQESEEVSHRLAYADWLEENGDPRAEFLRREQQLHLLSVDDARYEPWVEELRNLGDPFDARWLSIVSRPRLACTTWLGRYSPLAGGHYWVKIFFDEKLILGMEEWLPYDGEYDGVPEPSEHDHWKQVGKAIHITTTDNYANFHGIIKGERIVGRASNVVQENWTWEVERVATEQS